MNGSDVNESEVIAELLDLPPEAVNVKAGTCEGLDAVGRGEAIACWAIVLLQRAPGLALMQPAVVRSRIASSRTEERRGIRSP